MTSILIKKSCGHIVQSGPGILMGDAARAQALLAVAASHGVCMACQLAMGPDEAMSKVEASNAAIESEMSALMSDPDNTEKK